MIEQIFCSCCYSVVIVACRESILNYFAAQLSYFARAAQQKHEVLRAHASNKCQLSISAESDKNDRTYLFLVSAATLVNAQ